MLNILKESNYRNESINSVPTNNSNISVERSSSSPSRNEFITNDKPRLNPQQNVPERRPIRPILGANKSVPLDSFGGLANQKKTYQSSVSSNDQSVSSSEMSDSSSDEDLNSFDQKSSNSRQHGGNQYSETSTSSYASDDSSEDSDDDDIMMNQHSGGGGASRYSSGSSELSSDSGSESGSYNNYMDEPPQKSYEEIQREKQKILFDLDRLQKQGYAPSKRYNMASQLEEMQHERDKLKRQRDVEKSIKFSRKALMMVVSGVEYLNSKFDPFDIKLDGWSEKVMDDITDYDEIFEELHEKYGESVKMAPEVRLLATLAGSGFMFHLTNSIFKTATPDVNDIIRNNPDIKRAIQQAAVQNMNNGINQQLGANDPIGNLMKQGIQMKTGMPMNSGPSRPGPPPPVQTRPPPKMPSQQPTMRGPNGVDDLLNKLNSNNSDDDSVSESSFTMRSSGRRGAFKKTKKGGIELDLTG